jgi:hypothetical protein
VPLHGCTPKNKKNALRPSTRIEAAAARRQTAAQRDETTRLALPAAGESPPTSFAAAAAAVGTGGRELTRFKSHSSFIIILIKVSSQAAVLYLALRTHEHDPPRPAAPGHGRRDGRPPEPSSKQVLL